MRHRAAKALAVAALVLAGALCSALAVGALTIVTTQGVSMQPTYHAGDLVLVVPARSYPVGRITAYRDHLHHLVVLHRVVVSDPSGYQLKGDNNQSVDAVHPTRSDVIGRAVLHVPGAGAWLHRLLAPLPLTLLAGALVIGSSTRTRSPRRRQPVSRHAAPARSGIRALPASARLLATGAAVAGALGLALGALTWTTPVVAPRPGTPSPVGSLAFTYQADVGRTAAYDGTTVHAPDPVFRRLASVVQVGVAYRGAPGSLAVHAELSTASGWHTTVPLAPSRAVADGGLQDSVRLDLPDLERRAQAAAAVNGLPAGVVAVAVTAVVTRSDGSTFAPSLKLALMPQALVLADPASLAATQPPGPRDRVPTVQAFRRLLGYELPVAAGREASAVLLAGFALLGLAVLVIARRNPPPDESTGIQRRYASLLMSVHPMPTPTGQPVVEVTAFADLAVLAERQGLPVLHWTRSNVTTFVVRDGHTDYRYRTGTDRSGATVDAGDAQVWR